MPKNYDYELEGLQKVQRNLNEKIDEIEEKSEKGIKEAGLLVERESKQRTPVDTGNLKGGTYTETITSSKGTGVEIGYTAKYAIHVHERTELNHPVGEAKFLEKALRDNEGKILRLIQANAKV